MRLYLDANAIVFAVEGPDPLREFVTSWTGRAESAPGGVVLTSRLSVSECLTRPYREKDESRTIDALHVATALRANADVFLTRDSGIHRYASLHGMRCEPIPS